MDLDYLQKSKILKIKDILRFERDSDSKRKRLKMWRQFDCNNNGYLSLAEIDKGFKDLKLDEIFEAKKPLLRAFNQTKGISPAKDIYSDEFIEKNEFRLFLETLYKYYVFWIAFKMTD